ncbi:MAG: carboxypeptidase regulatory-like domain-containing protein [Saprospirales bacterium]|nr:carboxypeptidase regulatory-like domain-containing protein [Saprospirales bacterium]
MGELDELLSISSGLLNNYGKGANDLSGADYIQNAFWLTFNRYWRIQGANPIYQAVRVRFYFNEQDVNDLKSGLQLTGHQLQNLDAIEFYAHEGGSLHPFAIRTRSGASTLRQFKTGKTAKIGQWGPFYYAEFQLEDLSSSGSGGFYIPLEGQKFSISGKITSPTGDPIEDVYVRSKVEGAAVRTTTEGEFTVANLQGGQTYDITPYSQDRPTRMVTVLDLIGLAQHQAQKKNGIRAGNNLLPMQINREL